jgi:hypothetical protein
MHFATRVRTWRVSRLYSEIALSRKPFGIEHMYIYNFLLKMTDTMKSQNIYISSWDTLCVCVRVRMYIYIYISTTCFDLKDHHMVHMKLYGPIHRY